MRRRADTRSAISRAGTSNRCWPWPTRPARPIARHLGFSGICLTHPGRVLTRGFRSMRRWVWRCAAGSGPGLLVVQRIAANSIAVLEAVDLGFNLVMFSDEELAPEETVAQVKKVVPRPIRPARPSKRKWPCCPAWAAGNRAAGRYHLTAWKRPGVCRRNGRLRAGGEHRASPSPRPKTVRLDLDRFEPIEGRPARAAGAARGQLGGPSRSGRSSPAGDSQDQRRQHLEANRLRELSAACRRAAPEANPYEIIGSGLPADVMTPGRAAMQELVVDLMGLFGSEGVPRTDGAARLERNAGLSSWQGVNGLKRPKGRHSECSENLA